jgi:hypothetical protein
LDIKNSRLIKLKSERGLDLRKIFMTIWSTSGVLEGMSEFYTNETYSKFRIGHQLSDMSASQNDLEQGNSLS